MARVIGYLEGTDSLWLTNLQLLGIDTLPLSNGEDNHGRDMQGLSPQDHVDLVIGYLHKLAPPHEQELRAIDMLHATKMCHIPVLLACPAAGFAAGRARLGELPPNVILVDPGEVMARVQELLKTLPVHPE